MRLLSRFQFLIMTTVILTMGCEKPVPDWENISGTISYQDIHLTTGEILFYPSDGGEPIRVPIDRDGHYRAKEMRHGHYQIAITTPVKPEEGAKSAMRPNSPTPVYIPEKFFSPTTSGLEIELPTHGESMNFRLE